jgi:hypothetical protein
MESHPAEIPRSVGTAGGDGISRRQDFLRVGSTKRSLRKHTRMHLDPRGANNVRTLRDVGILMLKYWMEERVVVEVRCVPAKSNTSTRVRVWLQVTGKVSV